MLLQGKFQAKKLTKKVSKDKVYRTLWIKDESDDDMQVIISEDLVPKLKKNGVYNGIFDFSQFQRYEGYGVDDKVRLVDVQELKEDWNVTGAWDV